MLRRFGAYLLEQSKNGSLLKYIVVLTILFLSAASVMELLGPEWAQWFRSFLNSFWSVIDGDSEIPL